MGCLVLLAQWLILSAVLAVSLTAIGLSAGLLPCMGITFVLWVLS